MTATRTDQPYRTLYRVAGVASILFVALLLAALALDVAAPPPVTGGVETLEFIAGHKTTYIAEQLLWIMPGVLPVVTFLALYIALRDTSPSWALIGSVIGGLAWVLPLAMPVSSRGSLVLVTLSDWYGAADSAEARTAYATAAESIVAENNTPGIPGMLAAAAILVISLVMVRSPLPRTAAWLGIATGVVGVLSEALRYAVPAFYTAYGLLLWAWFVVLGVSFLRRAARMPSGPVPLPVRDGRATMHPDAGPR